VAGFVGHSFALITDGIESFSDVVSSSVVYFDLRFAIKPPDKEHPYGHGKAEPIAAAIASLALHICCLKLCF
jgi:divalent metal cation (Fe/Co/Zn/Cd) transporter